MNVIEPTEIILDRPRKLMINHRALRKAESEVNKLRFANPSNYANIDGLMIAAYNTMYRSMGLLPRDLMSCLLWAGLSDEDPKLTLDKIESLLDSTDASLAEISGKVWAAYFKSAGKNLVIVGEADNDAEKKTISEDQPTGLNSGASPALN